MEEAKTTPPSPQNSSASGAAAVKNNTPMLMGIAAIVTVVVVAVIVGVLILLNLPKTGGTDINTANPQEAVTQVNDVLEDAIIAIAEGNTTRAAQVFGDFASIDQAEFSMFVKATDTTGNVDLAFDGKVSTENNTPMMEGTLKLSGTIPDAPFTFATPAELDLVVTKDKLYLRVRNLPAELQALLAQLTLSSNTWYYLDLESAATSGQALSGNLLDADQLAELKQKLGTEDIFVNPRSTADRTVDGVTTKCMLVDGNSKLETETSAAAETNPPVEICSPDGSLLPVFFGVKDTQEGTDVEVGFSVNKVNTGFTVTAPEGAKDLEPILNALGAGM
jgi:hypothetical protein